MSAQNRSFNPYIHGLRGAAALLVYLFHVYDMSRLQGLIPEDFFFPLKLFIVSLQSGVDLFFMISGYLITASLIRHANVRMFLLDRAIRVYPVFLFLHVCLFIISPFIHYKWLAGISFGHWVIHFISNMLFLPGVFDLPLLQLNAWSLSYEFAFYLFSATAYLLFRRRPWAGWLLLLTVAPGLIFFYPRAAFFAVGAAVFFVVRNKHRWLVLSQKHLGGICIVPFFIILGYAYAIKQQQLCWMAVVPGFFIFLDIVRGAAPFAKMLEHNVMQFFGTISYSFYLWHPVVTYPLKLFMTKILVEKMGMNVALAIALFGVVAFAIAIPVSYVSYLVLERKVGGWLRSKTRHSHAAGA